MARVCMTLTHYCSVNMASPQKLISKLCSVSPHRLRVISSSRQFLSPETPIKSICRRKPNNENQLSPFNIDTPNRIKILENGLPNKHCTVLGTGGFGTVYKAAYKGDQVAAKVMSKKKCSREIINSEKHASILRHANIIKVLNIEEGTSLSLITMELCGTTLQDKLADCILNKHERIRVWRDITYALEFCHNAGVIHTDVKPANILIAASGRAKLSDFGSSILIGETYKSDTFHGTPGYAAPEVLKGSTPTTASDIYSLGISAWQLLSNKLPFAGLHPHTIIYLSGKGIRPQDEDTNDEFNGVYKDLYRQMWSQHVEDRPPINKIIDVLNVLIIE
ncbi:hypothetical protein KM043_010791 [Ampulex compressa]|nr:hypothetical protein KM043_010791 [Ampulex compressa]